MDCLPNEILIRILSFFPAETLETNLSNVCLRWKAVAEAIISQRITKLHNRVPPGMLAELRTQFVEAESTDLNLLKEFEKTHMMSSNIELRDLNMNWEELESVDEFLKYCAVEVFCEAVRSYRRDADNCCLENEFQCIPCHNLIAVRNAESAIGFYHETVISQVGPYHKYEFNNSELLSAGVRAFDVFNDKIVVVLRDTKRLILYKISEVDHNNRNLVLTIVKRIFFPLWVDAVKLFYDKIFVLFTSGDLGVWQESTDPDLAEITITRRPIVPNRADVGFRFRQMYADHSGTMFRLQNLLLISIVASEVPTNAQHYYDVQWNNLWYILDMNTDSPDAIQLIPIDKISARISHDQSIGLMCSVRTFANIIIFQSQGTTFAAVLKSDPKKDDFLDMVKFDELIAHGHSSIGSPGTDCSLVRNIRPTLFNTTTMKHLILGFYSFNVNPRRYGQANFCLGELGVCGAAVLSISDNSTQNPG